MFNAEEGRGGVDGSDMQPPELTVDAGAAGVSE